MTEAAARTTANLVLAAAGVAAAYVVFTTPPLRRFAARAVRMWLGASVPVYLMGEARRAWIESGQTSGPSSLPHN
jgi:hypothetical protein